MSVTAVICPYHFSFLIFLFFINFSTDVSSSLSILRDFKRLRQLH